jgi:hypothetical protein
VSFCDTLSASDDSEVRMKINYMDKKITDAVKGICLIFMFIHHFFTFPDWNVEGISYPLLDKISVFISQPFRMCVPVFAFLTGYFYFLSSKKNLRYTFKKIFDIYLHYWIVFVPFLMIALVTGCFRFKMVDVFLEFFAIKQDIMYFCWYVPFYVLAMLLLLVLTKLGKTPIGDVVFLLIIPVLGCRFLMFVCDNGYLYKIVSNVRIWFPCVASGYLCAKYNLFSKLDQIVSRLRYKILRLILYILFVVGTFASRYFMLSFTVGIMNGSLQKSISLVSMDVISAPLFVYGLAKLLYQVRGKKIMNVLVSVGKQSLLMWFLHCIFFNRCKEITQRILFFPKDPLLVLVFGLLMCYVVAILLNALLNLLRRKRHQ